MIESIAFKNFKALRDTTLPLGPCTVIVGPNGSGKSTVLQALEAASGRNHPKYEDIATVDLQADDNAVVEVRMRWAASLTGQEGIESIWRWNRVEAHRRGREPDFVRCDPELYERFRRDIRVFSFEAAAIASPIPMAREMELARNGAGLAGVLTQMQDREPERFDALNAGVASWLPEYDRILLDSDASGQRVLSLRMRRGQHKIPAHDLSQGTLLALAMLALAHLPHPPSLVGLEEPDRGLHPHLLRRVQDAMYRLSHPESCRENRPPVQVVATTHSPYFIDLFRDHPEEIVVANKSDVDVRFERLTDQPYFTEILGDAPLGEAWFTGVLGGVPSAS
jgi:predicted ATPase